MTCSMGTAVAPRSTVAMETATSSSVSQRVSFVGRRSAVVAFGIGNGSARVTMAAAGAAAPKGGKQQKKEIDETLLTPRFYTTDFDEMEQLFNVEINKNLNEAEFESLLAEFKADYNQTHFVRNPEFKVAADKIQGPLRQIFVEFLERSCTAEFSGFLLYKELGRRLKVSALTSALWFDYLSPFMFLVHSVPRYINMPSLYSWFRRSLLHCLRAKQKHKPFLVTLLRFFTASNFDHVGE